jgi:hypothetical protein
VGVVLSDVVERESGKRISVYGTLCGFVGPCFDDDCMMIIIQ